MSTATSTILGGCDLCATIPPFEIGRATVHANGRFGTKQQLSIPEALQRSPNLALVYQRYLPAHGAPSFDQGETQVLGVSWSGPWATACAQPAQQRQQDKARNKVRAAANEWRGSGVLEWLCELARVQGPAQDMWEAISRQRREALADATWVKLEVLSPLAIGLGNPSIKENAGVAWHHTYGVPIIPGASLKGLLRHYLTEELGGNGPQPVVGILCQPDDSREAVLAWAHARREGESSGGAADHCSVPDLATLLVGEAGDKGGAGIMCFHDALPTGAHDAWLDVDVLTSHHPEYYTADQRDQTKALETDEPNPVHFLVVRRGVTFDLPISLTHRGRALPSRVRDGALAMTLQMLADALRMWGIGAKTGAGYGRAKVLSNSLRAGDTAGREEELRDEVEQLARARRCGLTDFRSAARAALSRGVALRGVWPLLHEALRGELSQGEMARLRTEILRISGGQ
jgi:CRISPR type III-B/RAMP module RAMP protein Cmr6